MYIVLVHPRYYNNTMTSLEELENQCLPISKLKKYATEWVIKVLVIRRSLTKEYKNTNGEGIRWQLILVDEEVTLFLIFCYIHYFICCLFFLEF